jgi:ubiquinone/menaquinone biosynthesis C-methylase UbiE
VIETPASTEQLLDREPLSADGRVTADFDLAAPRYDLMVALNPGYHRHLRSAAGALLERLPDRAGVPVGPPREPRLLDLGCGSGASTRALLAADPNVRPEIVAVDASSGMLARARDKDWPAGVQFVQGLAQDLPARRAGWGLDDPVDGVFAAYLFRNLPAADAPLRAPGGLPGSTRDDVLRAVRNVLVPGGVFVTQEYSVAGSRTAWLRWTATCHSVVMPLSRLTRTDVELYDYLWQSVLRFDSVAVFADRLWQAGFVDVEVRTVAGWQRGILHTFRARVPS